MWQRIKWVLTAVALFESHIGLAADMPVRLKELPVAALPWAGFYGGANIGYGWGRNKFFDNFPTPDGELDANATLHGFVSGLQGGYNWWLSPSWLAGLEGDFALTNIRNTFPCFRFGDQLCSAQAEWIGSVSGRLGLTYGLWLFYGKGGVGWANDHFFDVATCAGSQPRQRGGITAACGDPFFSDQSRPGWLVGLGLEYLFAHNWSAKLEYDYLDFGSRSVPLSDGGNGFFTEQINQQLGMIKLGFNYHFEAATPPGDYAAASWSSARAQSPSARGKPPAADEPEDLSRVLAFTTFDVSKHSYGGVAGALIAPFQDLDTSGLRVYLVGELGTYRYPTQPGFIRGVYESGSALAGYALEGDFYSINLLAGLDAINHTLSDVDVTNKVQGTEFGLKMRGDAWVNPTPITLTYGEAEYSTAFQTFYTKAKYGYDFTGGRGIFFGPEVAILGDERFTQWRVGAHVTQMKFGKVELDVSAGYAHDSIVGEGAYGTFELSTNF